VFVFTRDTRAAGVDLHARMFAPAMGVAEDPATGAAVAALSGYLTRRVPGDGRHRWTIAQGVEMGRPSRLELEVEVQAGKATRVRVGGRAVLMAEGTIEVPSA
jgi:trans-2,3-dihydro-3-hydroxyanthranilate isomerase